MEYNNLPKSKARRKIILGAAAGILASTAFSKLAYAAGKLIIYGPTAGPSIVLANINVPDLLSDNMPEIGFKLLEDPEQIGAQIKSGQIKAAVLPIHLAAKLYNQGQKIKLLNIMTNGFFYILTNNPEMGGIGSLKGKAIAIPFKNDVPELVFKKILASYKLKPGSDIDIKYTDSAAQASDLLLNKKVSAALLAEPDCTTTLAQARESEVSAYRTIDLQTLWGEVAESDPIIPQAGLVVADSLDADTPRFSDRLQTIIEKTIEQVNNDPLNSGAKASKVLNYPAQIIASSIPTSNLVATRAEFARSNIEKILNMLAEYDTSLIGSTLPDSDFFL